MSKSGVGVKYWPLIGQICWVGFSAKEEISFGLVLRLALRPGLTNGHAKQGTGPAEASSQGKGT